MGDGAMTGSELSLVLIMIMLVRLVLLLQPWPVALLVALLAMERGRAIGMAAAGGVVAGALLWLALAASGLGALLLDGAGAGALLLGFVLLMAGLTWLSARVALGRGDWNGGRGPVPAGALAGSLYALQPLVGRLWTGGDTGPLQLDVRQAPSALLALALVAAVFALLAWLGTRPGAQAFFARHRRLLHALAALAFALTALGTVLVRLA